MKAPPLPLWRMPRARYDRLVEAGVFGPDDRVELLDGLLVARGPQGARHATVVALVRAVLEKAFGRSYHVREEKPIALDEQSEPEPDIVVVPGRPRDYLDAHPSRPVLVVEVAESSLALDRLREGGLEVLERDPLFPEVRVQDLAVVNQERRRRLEEPAQPLRAERQLDDGVVEAEDHPRTEEPAPEGVVGSDHRVLDHVRDDQQH